MDDVEVAEESHKPPPPSPPLKRGLSPAAAAPRQESPPPPPSYVYALGRVEPQFPSIALEKELAQVIGRDDTAGQTDRQAMHAVLSDRANRYLARQMCWVFTIQGLETYLLAPRDPADVELLINAVRPQANPNSLDVVIGVRGPIARPEACNGLMVPIVLFDQLYSFDREELIDAIPRPENLPEADEDQFHTTAADLFERVIQISENSGAGDDHRALNYLAVRYPAIYARATEAHIAEASLTAVDVRPSGVGGTRKMVDVVFAYTNRRTDVTDKYSVRVDVEDEFPFLVRKLSAYYEH